MYTKFLILTTQRSGSTHLTHLLGTHPNITTYSELYNDSAIGWGRWRPTYAKSSPRTLFYLRNFFPHYFLRHFIYKKYPNHIHAVGFKIMYSQLEKFPSLIPYLISQNVQILHLQRTNLLDVLVSLKRSEVANIWHTTTTSHPNVRLYIEVDECREFFEKQQNLQMHYSKLIAKANSMTVTYEQIHTHEQSEIRKIQTFLGVHPSNLHSIFHKMNDLPHHATIINFDELSYAFKQTPWKHFFKKTL